MRLLFALLVLYTVFLLARCGARKPVTPACGWALAAVAALAFASCIHADLQRSQP